MGRPPTTTHKEMLDVIRRIIKQGYDPDQDDDPHLLLTRNSLQSHYIEKEGKHLSLATIRNYGFAPGGYFCHRWPDIFKWRTKGKPSTRGMVINAEKFMEEVDVGQIEI